VSVLSSHKSGWLAPPGWFQGRSANVSIDGVDVLVMCLVAA